MITKRNWTIPAIISGIIFFTIIGFILSSEIFSLNEFSKTIVVYWCIGLIFATILCLPVLKKETFREKRKIVFEEAIFFSLSLLFSAILLESHFFPILAFLIFLASWIIWAILRSVNAGKELTFLNIIIISWMVFGITVSLGQWIGYASVLIEKIYGFTLFLDLRISLAIIILASIFIISFGKIDFNEIRTRELLKIKDDKGNTLLIIVSLFFVLINFLIQIAWWLGKFIFLWGQECIAEIKKKSVENKDTLLNLAMIIFSILGLFTSLKLSRYLVEEYLPNKKTIDEILPFFMSLLLVCLTLISAYLVIRFKNLSWNNWSLVLNKNEFNKDDKNFRETIAFPILTSGLSGIILFGLSKISSFKITYFNNYGIFSWILSIGLLIAITITIINTFSSRIENEKN